MSNRSISITALVEPISIVHIPLVDLPLHSEALYRTIDFTGEESREFFNLTSNAIEVAVFASATYIEEEWHKSPHINAESHLPTACGGVQISASKWRAFQIESDEEDGDVESSPHLRDVSTPLAEAGVSILYTSSHFTDFLFVKEADFEHALEIFQASHWPVDIAESVSSIPSTPSAYMSSRTYETAPPRTPPERTATFDGPLSAPILRSAGDEGDGLVIARPPSEPFSGTKQAPVQIHQPVRSPDLAACGNCGSPVPAIAPSASSTPVAPVVPEVSVLSEPLACVGFNKDCEANWSEIVRKFLVYPDRARRVRRTAGGSESPAEESPIRGSPRAKQPRPSQGFSTKNPGRQRPRSLVLSKLEVSTTRGRQSVAPAASTPARGSRPFISYTRTKDGTSLTTEVAILRGLFPNQGGARENMLQSGGELDSLDLPDFEASDSEIESDIDERPRRSESVPLPGTHDAERGRPRTRARSGTETFGIAAPSRLDPKCPVRIIPIEWLGSPSARDGIDRRRSMGGIAAYKSWVEERDRTIVKRQVTPGLKRCLQLDLRGFPQAGKEVFQDDDAGVYHLGARLTSRALADADRFIRTARAVFRAYAWRQDQDAVCLDVSHGEHPGRSARRVPGQAASGATASVERTV